MARTSLVRRCAVGAALAALAAPPSASAAVVSLWHMDETSGTTMVDSRGANPGTLHGGVAIGQPGFLGTAYRFPGEPAIVTVPSSASLNPGSASFSVTVHVNTSVVTSDDSADLIRKGLSTNSKTYWKMELRPSSTRQSEKVRCYFRGSSAIASVFGASNVADGRWHTITCIKKADSVAVVLDGNTRTKATRVGSISNNAALTVGAKSSTDDALQGRIDEVSFAR